MVRVAALVLALPLLPVQDPPPPDPQLAEKLYARMLRSMNEGRYTEGRSIAEFIAEKFPASPFAAKARPFTADTTFLTMVPEEITGPMSNRIDLVIMGDAVPYEDAAQRIWGREAEAILKTLFKSQVFKEYAPYFNQYKAHVASKDGRLIKPDTPAVTYFKSVEEDGELITTPALAQRITDLLGANDGLGIVHVRASAAEHAKSGYGTAVVAFGHPAPALVLHAFGHAFAGLADEASSRKSWAGLERKIKDPPPPPIAPNISETKDPAAVPWAHWLKAKEEGDKRASKVGVMEGASLRPKNVWRPVDETLCVMNDGSEFCPVCREALILVLYTYLRPIDEAAPYAGIVTAEGSVSARLWIRTLRPATHKLTVGWFVEKVEDGTKTGADCSSRAGDTSQLRGGSGRLGQRRGEGSLWKMPKGQTFDSDPNPDPASTKESLTLDRARLAPGRYRVTVVVRDGTEWVLQDSQNLMVDWRTWIVEIK